ncbi:hypothetical protein LTR70_006171 [Exophiala xenobiotica]|uniref:Nephrocystin 3-like N-terminal domain-containing protein n=1 Tax=Lithohypha guttulata TaxID=1690604 RepID=A0ABR0K7P7_9EURO|nr:hypothetical protein LTR24_005849 [Lithohypha guttulata]KAK5316622.1 hypothetical protein LTR70_006171 [Exophiala xenobiotica]
MAGHQTKRPRLDVQEEMGDREVLYNGPNGHAGVANQAISHHDNLGYNGLNQYAHQHALPHNTLHQILQPTNKSTRKYDETAVEGQGVVQQGDNHGVININHGICQQAKEDDAYKVKLDKLMENLTFVRMEARLHNVAIAIPKTCGWVRDHSQFRKWSDKREIQKHNGFLWIEGKPGCGKSTIMKSTFAWAKKHWRKQFTILNYFFNARVPGSLEKSSLGLYRSLVHQLLSALPHIGQSFVERFASKIRTDTFDEWTELELQNFLFDVVRSDQPPKLCIFVDALDEGREDDIRDMVAFLERLVMHASSPGESLRICLSSRHYPFISIKGKLSLTVEDETEHRHDIELYVRESLVPEDDSSPMDELRELICHKSQRIFLWVVLVVRMLNKMSDKGSGWLGMRRRLDDTPGNLDGLFTKILEQSSENIEECTVLLQWVLFSMRPMTEQELYLAVQYSYQTQHLVSQNKWDVVAPAEGPLVHGYVDPKEHDLQHDVSQDSFLGRIQDPQRLQIVPEMMRWRNLLERYEARKYKSNVPLLYALAEEDAPNLVQALLDGTVDVNAVGGRYGTALQAACFAGHEQVLQSLMQGDANVNVNCGKYDNAMIAAIHGKHLSIAKTLEEHGALLSQRQLDGTLVTMVARGWISGVNFLLDRGANANTNADINKPKPALEFAISRKNSEMANLLLQRGSALNWRSSGTASYGAKYEFSNALQLACFHGLTDIVRVLFDRGQDPNFDGRSPLHAASSQGHLSIVKYLLENGGDVNACDKDNSTVLHAACRGGDLSVVKYLLENGANVSACDKDNRTALHVACHVGNPSMVTNLLENGANVNTRKGVGDTPLQIACRWASLEIVKLLLDRGAEVNAAGGSWHSALHAAVTLVFPNTDKVAMKLKLLEMLLEAGANIHRTSGQNRTLCSLAVDTYYSNTEVLKFLIEKGADVNAKNTEGLCALVVASTHRSPRPVEVLIEAGAGYDIHQGVDHDVWKRAIAAAALKTFRTGEERNQILQLLQSGLRQAEERWANQQREN